MEMSASPVVQLHPCAITNHAPIEEKKEKEKPCKSCKWLSSHFICAHIPSRCFKPPKIQRE